MTKLKLLLILILAIVGALLIHNHFEKINQQKQSINKFSSEYELVDENNIYKYSTIDEIIELLTHKTGISFLCSPESEWCQFYALYLNDVAKENNIDVIHYLNIKDERNLNTVKYQKLLEILSTYVYKDDLNNTKIFMPDLTFVKDGHIVVHDNETSLVASDTEPKDYWNKSKINEFKSKISSYIRQMNEYVVINKEEENGL